MIEKNITSEIEMQNLGKEMSNHLLPGTVLYLSGPLGVGKTTLIRGILYGLGHEGKVKSPSYAIVEPYHFKDFNIFHFDFYRVKNPTELFEIGIEEYFNPKSIAIIEWPEKAENLLPKADLFFQIEFHQESRRCLISANTPLGKKILSSLGWFDA